MKPIKEILKKYKVKDIVKRVNEKDLKQAYENKYH